MSDLITRPEAPHWTARHGKPIIFVILTLIAVGAYLALTIPVSVFPETNFPRIVVGIDNGVFPIDQMLVTVTKPIEEAVNTVPGLDHLWSITSRGTAEVDLFFSWKVDMYRTLELVNAAMARAQSNLPATAKITVNRLTFAAFPIMGYSLTSDKFSQDKLWEMANYDLKPRLNRQDGVSSIIVQGGQVPEFEVQPDPAKLVQSGITIPNILDAINRSNMIDSPGLIEANHQLVLSLVTGQARTATDIGDIVIKTTPAGAPLRIGDVATVGPSVMPVYTVVTANGKPAVLLNVYRQPDSNTVVVADAVKAEIERIPQGTAQGNRAAPVLRSIGDRPGIHRQRARRDPDRADPGVADHGVVSAGLGHFAGGRAGDSGHDRDYLHHAAHHGRELQPDDAGRARGRRGPGDRRRHRGGGKHRDAPR